MPNAPVMALGLLAAARTSNIHQIPLLHMPVGTCHDWLARPETQASTPERSGRVRSSQVGIFERESFERISDDLKDLQKQQDAGDITPNEAEERRREILAQAFNRGAIDRLLREGGFEGDSVEFVKDAWRRGAIEWIRDDEHLTALFHAIRGVSSHLYIYSGWVRPHVVDLIQTDLTAALDRGASVYIGFGWESPSGSAGEDPSQEDAVKRLERINDRAAHGGRIVVRRSRNHSQLLICDDAYVNCGSANWLSNSQFHNREVSVRIEDEGLTSEFAALAAADFPPNVE